MAEQDVIEHAVRKRQLQGIAQGEADPVHPALGDPLPGASKHTLAQVDADHLGMWRIRAQRQPGAHANVQYAVPGLDAHPFDSPCGSAMDNRRPKHVVKVRPHVVDLTGRMLFHLIPRAPPQFTRAPSRPQASGSRRRVAARSRGVAHRLCHTCRAPCCGAPTRCWPGLNAGIGHGKSDEQTRSPGARLRLNCKLR